MDKFNTMSILSQQTTSKYIWISLLLLGSLTFLHAQMPRGNDILYGNEWINYDQAYYKIPVAEDGVYHISFELLQQSGFPVTKVEGRQYQLWHLGEEMPLYVSSEGLLQAGDYLAFVGEKNRSELDNYLFKDPETEMLNPRYSLITDTSSYFLTWVEAGILTQRFQTIETDLNNLPSPETYFMDKAELVFAAKHSKAFATLLWRQHH